MLVWFILSIILGCSADGQQVIADEYFHALAQLEKVTKEKVHEKKRYESTIKLLKEQIDK